jgi:hypothetical protein
MSIFIYMLRQVRRVICFFVRVISDGRKSKNTLAVSRVGVLLGRRVVMKGCTPCFDKSMHVCITGTCRV